jgi:hypothetical protein
MRNSYRTTIGPELATPILGEKTAGAGPADPTPACNSGGVQPTGASQPTRVQKVLLTVNTSAVLPRNLPLAGEA